MTNNKKTTIAIPTIILLLMMTTITAMPSAEAKSSSSEMVYDPDTLSELKGILENIGTTVKEETKSGDTLITTYAVTQDSDDEYEFNLTVTVNDETVHNEDFQVTKDEDGNYRLINESRDIDITFTANAMTTRGSVSISATSAKIKLVDSAYGGEDTVIGLTDNYNHCGNARFDAGVNTAGHTFIEWDASNHFWSYCFIYEGFDYVKISHEGHNVNIYDNESSTTMSNSNGAGTYTVRVTVHYD